MNQYTTQSLSEPAAIYATDDYSRVAELLSVEFSDELNMAEQLVAGLPVEAVNTLAAAGIKRSEISNLVAPARTLQHRQSKGEPLSPEESERALRLARVIAQAETVWGDHDAALAWLRKPLRRFASKAPLDMLHTDVGARLVEHYLIQIDEGYAA